MVEGEVEAGGSDLVGWGRGRGWGRGLSPFWARQGLGEGTLPCLGEVGAGGGDLALFGRGRGWERGLSHVRAR